MTLSKLIQKIADEFVGIDTDDLTESETRIASFLLSHGYLRFENDYSQVLAADVKLLKLKQKHSLPKTD